MLRASVEQGICARMRESSEGKEGFSFNKYPLCVGKADLESPLGSGVVIPNVSLMMRPWKKPSEVRLDQERQPACPESLLREMGCQTHL